MAIDVNSTLFAGFSFFVDQHLPESTKENARDDLLAGGAHETTSDQASLIITDSFAFQGRSSAKPDAMLATPTWITQCIATQKLMEPKYYSPDPNKFLSGLVITASDLPHNDAEAMASAVLAYGGQWRYSFTKDVTHLIAAAPQGAKYELAMKLRENIGLEVIVPAWFHDCVRLQQLIPTRPYSYPNPSIYTPTASTSSIDTKAAPESVTERLKRIGSSDKRDVVLKTAISEIGKTSDKSGDLWHGLVVMLSDKEDLGVNEEMRATIEASIVRRGGKVRHQTKNGPLEDAQVYICRIRGTPTYLEALDKGLTIGNLAWLSYVEQTGRLTRPLDQVLHYPVPGHPIPGFENYMITVTNYNGDSREYMKRLITTAGGQFTANMTSKNTHVIAAHLQGTKAAKARDWNIPVLNHTWLEDCFLQWKNLPFGGATATKYSTFPVGFNFTDVLATKGYMGFSDDDLDTILREPARPKLQPQPEQAPATRPAVSVPALQAARVASSNAPASSPQPRTSASTPRRPQTVLAKDTPAKTDLPTPKRTVGSLTAVIPTKPFTSRPTATPKATERPPEPPSEWDEAPAGLDWDPPAEPVPEGEDETEPVRFSAPKKTKGAKLERKKITEAMLGRPRASSSKECPRDTSTASARSKPAFEPLDTDDDDDDVQMEEMPPPPRPGKKPTAKGSKASRKPDLNDDGSEAESFVPPPKSKKGKSRASELPTSTSGSPSPSTGADETPFTRDTPMEEPSGGRRKRGAAMAAENKLRDVVMPDVMAYEKAVKNSHGDVRKMALPGKKKRGRDDDDEDEEDSRETAQKRRRSSPVPPKKGAKAFGKSKARVKEETDDEESGEGDAPSASTKQRKPSDLNLDKVPAGKKPYIVTTQVKFTDVQEAALRKMGARLGNEMHKCTHLVTGGISRTIKFVCGVARGCSIVTAEWVERSISAGRFLDPENFLPFDPKKEKELGFNLKRSLERARSSKLFSGHKFYISKNVPVEFVDLHSVITGCGGQAYFNQVKNRFLLGDDDAICNHVVSCVEDRSMLGTLPEKGIPIYTKEIIIKSALAQEVDWADCRLEFPSK